MVQTYININGDIRDSASLTKPNHRVFRNAWQFNGNAVEVEMTAAREIHKNKLRAERAPKLNALDAKWFLEAEKANASGQAAVAAKKQALRDAIKDSRIESATTPEELQALTLDVLLTK